MHLKRILALGLAASLLFTGCGAAADSSGASPEASVSSSAKIESETGSISEAADSSSEKTAESSSEEVQSASGDIFAMDTYMTITTYGEKCEEALAAAEAEITRLDNLLSVGNADSEISQINTNGSGEISEDSQTMIEEALHVWETTDGAFDITVYPLMVAWGFTSGDFQVPEEETLQMLLSEAGSDKLTLDGSTLTLSEGQGIDLGGIAKGYTSSRLMEIFEEYDLVCGLISLGGNVQCYGTKPDGSLWRCGIQDPNNPNDGSALLGILSVADTAVITSGAYERNFTDEETGKTYHHILDPSTGYPAEAGLISATVVSSNGTRADGLSTACYVMGLDKSIEYWQTYGDDFDLILMTEDNEVYVTAPIADNFTSDYTVHVIEREE